MQRNIYIYILDKENIIVLNNLCKNKKERSKKYIYIILLHEIFPNNLVQKNNKLIK